MDGSRLFANARNGKQAVPMYNKYGVVQRCAPRVHSVMQVRVPWGWVEILPWRPK